MISPASDRGLSLLPLTEYATAERIALSDQERDVLLDRGLGMDVRPTRGAPGCYDLTPSLVGTIVAGGKLLAISPRFGIRNTLFLLSYALDPRVWKDFEVPVGTDGFLTEAIAAVFAMHLRRAFARGVLPGYEPVEESATTVRGRIRLSDQMRRHFGRSYPVEIAFDEFTDDTLANRILKAALSRIARVPLRVPTTRRALGQFETVLENVALVDFGGAIPDVPLTRLNASYGGALGLARLILRSIGLEHRSGRRSSFAFLIDMATVFEDFLVVALREALPRYLGDLVQGATARPLWLDAEGRIPLKPDVSLWQRGRCRFVADAKYKAADGVGANTARPADLYQLLAYTVGADVPDGALVYAAGKGARHTVTQAGKTLEVLTLDLQAQPSGVLSQVGDLAANIAARMPPPG